MELILDKEVRTELIRLMSNYSKEHPNLSSANFNIEKIDSTSISYYQKLQDIQDRVKSLTGRELSIISLGLLTLSFMALTFSADETKQLIPWRESDKSPNPNFVVSCLLINAVNDGIAVLKLLQDGLEYPARLVLRAFLEVSWLSIISTGDKNIMKLYAQDLDDKSEKRLYRQHLSQEKLTEYLTRIENSIGLTEEDSKNLAKVRKDLYSLYSKTIHNSYPAAIAGAFFSLLDVQQDNEVCGFLGEVSLGTPQTIFQLGEALFYLLAMIPQVLECSYGIPCHHSLEWQRVHALSHCYISLFYQLAKDK